MREWIKEQQIQQVQKNYVQMPDFTQSFNRYSYALNNPLKYVDENGEFFGLMGGFIRGLWKVITKGDPAPFKEGWKR